MHAATLRRWSHVSTAYLICRDKHGLWRGLRGAKITLFDFAPHAPPDSLVRACAVTADVIAAAEMPAPDAATAASVRAAGGTLLPNGVCVSGWRITCTKTPIMGREELRRRACLFARAASSCPHAAARLEAAVNTRSLPEMCFGSALELLHEASGVALRFDALDALRAWHAAPLPPVQVACATAWSTAHEKRLKDGAIRGWDASAVAAAGEAPFDWTFTTPFAGSVTGGNSSPAPSWRRVDERIDRSLLLARDPILFFDDVTLYESELDDNGTMSLTVKARGGAAAVSQRAHGGSQIRVMPACWFVLMRYFLRVDGVLLRCVLDRHSDPSCLPKMENRLRETRVFCATADAAASKGGATVMRECSVRDETFDGLKLRCARSCGYFWLPQLTKKQGRSGHRRTVSECGDGFTGAARGWRTGDSDL